MIGFAEAWVRKCWECEGVFMGPELDDGVLATPEEHATWSCQRCNRETEFNYEDEYVEIRLPNVSDRLMLTKSKRLDYNKFIDWATEKRKEWEASQ